MNCTWRSSTYCANGSCVECATDGNVVMVRDNKLNCGKDSPVLEFSTEAWADFLYAVRTDAFSA